LEYRGHGRTVGVRIWFTSGPGAFTVVELELMGEGMMAFQVTQTSDA
jgi:hypothetical protein